MADALRSAGVVPGDRVAYLLPNVPELVVAHFGVPLAGAALVAINTRLAAEEIRYICDHAEAVVLVVDAAFADLVTPLLGTFATVRTVVTVVDAEGPLTAGVLPGTVDYRALLDEAEPGGFDWSVDDKQAPIAINYTSGTTGRPKGVVYTHRGAYLASLGGLAHAGHSSASVYLWTLPMLHCNGGAGVGRHGGGGTQVCLRDVRGEPIWQLIDAHDVTHLNGAPTVVTTIMNAENARRLNRPLVITTAGAPPSPTTIQQMEQMGFTIIHVYGLTETYGPYAVRDAARVGRPRPRRSGPRQMSRQGRRHLHTEGLRGGRAAAPRRRAVDVPADGQTMGEIVMRGNGVMKGYFEDPEGTEIAFAGGRFHSGDLGVMHPDGYVELRDRAKDVVGVRRREHRLPSRSSTRWLVPRCGGWRSRWSACRTSGGASGRRRSSCSVRVSPSARLLCCSTSGRRSPTARHPGEIEFLAELPKTSTGKFDLEKSGPVTRAGSTATSRSATPRRMRRPARCRDRMIKWSAPTPRPRRWR